MDERIAHVAYRAIIFVRLAVCQDYDLVLVVAAQPNTCDTTSREGRSIAVVECLLEPTITS